MPCEPDTILSPENTAVRETDRVPGFPHYGWECTSKIVRVTRKKDIQERRWSFCLVGGLGGWEKQHQMGGQPGPGETMIVREGFWGSPARGVGQGQAGGWLRWAWELWLWYRVWHSCAVQGGNALEGNALWGGWHGAVLSTGTT